MLRKILASDREMAAPLYAVPDRNAQTSPSAPVVSGSPFYNPSVHLSEQTQSGLVTYLGLLPAPGHPGMMAVFSSWKLNVDLILRE